MDYKELQEFIKAVAKSGVSEVNIKSDDIKINIRMHPNSKQPKHTETIIQPIPINNPIPQITIPNAQTPEPQATPKAETPKTEPENTDKYIKIKSPMVGTFYRRPNPKSEPFVNAGDTISPNSVVCIIEAMKLFNEIEAEVSGKVVKFLVDDGTPVDFGQDLLLVDPA